MSRLVSNNGDVKGLDGSGNTAIRVFGEITTTAGGAGANTIYNVSAATAGQEYSQALSTNTKRFMIKTKANRTKLQISFVNGESGTKFITIPKGASYVETDLDLTGVTIYFQANKDSQTIEITEWV